MTTTHSPIQHVRDLVDECLALRRDEIFEVVRGCIAETLRINAGDVRAGQLLTDELGAQSLDLVDLVFRLQRTYGLKIPRGGIRSLIQAHVAGGIDEDGMVTQDGLEQLKVLMPEVDPARLRVGLAIDELSDVFTVETFVRLVAWRLAETSRAAAS